MVLREVSCQILVKLPNQGVLEAPLMLVQRTAPKIKKREAFSVTTDPLITPITIPQHRTL